MPLSSLRRTCTSSTAWLREDTALASVLSVLRLVLPSCRRSQLAGAGWGSGFRGMLSAPTGSALRAHAGYTPTAAAHSERAASARHSAQLCSRRDACSARQLTCSREMMLCALSTRMWLSPATTGPCSGSSLHPGRASQPAAWLAHLSGQQRSRAAGSH